MLQLICHAIMLLLPGSVFAYRHAANGSRLLVAMGLGIAVAVAVVVAAKWLTLSIPMTLTLWALVVVALIAAAILITPVHRAAGTRALDAPWWLGLIVVLAVAISYQLWAGPYVEIPADALAHLEYGQAAWRDLRDGEFAVDARIGLHHDKAADYWYYINALLVTVSGGTIGERIGWSSLANVTSFLVATYAFAHVVFRPLSNPLRRTLLALVATLFITLHFGTNIFAFIRYYALAPVMINMIVYFAAIAVIVSGSRAFLTPLQIALVAAFTGAAALVHAQEALFIMVMGIALVCFDALRIKGWIEVPAAAAPTDSEPARWAIPVTWAAAGLIALSFAVVAWAHVTFVRWPMYPPRIISVEHIFPFIKHLYILNPSLHFYDTVTIWGVMLYVVFAFNWRRLLRFDYLTVAMLSPLFTVFNPVFVDFFLRFAGGHNLYRLCFIIPLAFIGAWWLLDNAGRLRHGGWRARAGALTAISLLVVLLFPFNATYVASPWSRVGNLAPTPAASREWISDLITFMAQQPGTRKVITDPVTGYTVSALTPHRALRKKFYTPRVKQLDPDYLGDPNNAEQLDGVFLIVNLRDGPPSASGRRSRHWPEEILTVSRHYDERLRALVDADSTRFVPVWEASDITVYRITSAAKS